MSSPNFSHLALVGASEVKIPLLYIIYDHDILPYLASFVCVLTPRD